MKLGVALELGRISNIPTVMTNLLVGMAMVLSINDILATHILGFIGLFIGLSCFYLGGMFFNDYCDREWDQQHNIARPIVRGEVSEQDVFRCGFAFFLVGFVGIYILKSVLLTDSIRIHWDLIGLLAALISMIVLYDVLHKQFSWSPWLMGCCRSLVYLISAYFFTAEPPNVEWFFVSIACGLYVVAITYVARLEHINRIGNIIPVFLLFSPLILLVFLWINNSHYILLQERSTLDLMLMILVCVVFVSWVLLKLRQILIPQYRSIPKAVGGLIAGISLMDALVLACIGATFFSVFSIVLFFLTLRLHRWVSGT